MDSPAHILIAGPDAILGGLPAPVIAAPVAGIDPAGFPTSVDRAAFTVPIVIPDTDTVAFAVTIPLGHTCTGLALRPGSASRSSCRAGSRLRN